MIVKMSKYAFLVFHKEYDRFLDILRDLGVVHVDQILKVDESKRVVYFLANGKNPGENPYYEHLYRASLDGSGLQQLSAGDYFHADSG